MSAPTALVTGASRGFGRGIADALAATGHTVVALARDGAALDAPTGRYVPVAGDAADPRVARDLIAAHRPRVLVLNAGAVPATEALPEQTWESFSRPWEVDVRQVFHWSQEALRQPLAPGSLVVAMSSGAAVAGSPMSGGYAGAKAMVRFIARYAAEEATRRDLGVRFVALLPALSPGTGVGDAGARAYAKRQGIGVAGFVANLGPVLTPAAVGAAVVELAGGTVPVADAYLLTVDGLRPLD